MRTRIMLAIGLMLGLAATARAQDVVWRPAKSVQAAVPISLGQPTPFQGSGSFEAIRPVSVEAPRVVRGQAGPTTPPPAFPGAPVGPAVFPTGPAGVDTYNRGMPNNDADLGGFWTRTGDKLKRCWDDVTGGVGSTFQGDARRQPFQSDPDFAYFTSPVTNPFFFEDPRSLTEIRPLFIWQNTSNNNPTWAGGNNFHFAVRGSVAITDRISVVVSRLGFTSINPRGGNPDIVSGSGLSELLIGPKFTIIHNETSRTVAALGLTFEIPTGSSKVLQDTGSTALVPYFSIAQNFGRTQAGSFNFMNTTGYAFRTDNTRSESFYSSFHLDFNWGDGNRIYPMVELNWRHYMRNGGARDLNFEGNDLANFGSRSISGRDDLNLAVGTRVVINKNITWGIAAEFNILNNGDGRHMDQFRLTTDFIFRY